MIVRTLCVAGAESTGKSWLAGRVARHFGVTAVAEYARSYCAQHGNDLSMDQLSHIGAVQDAHLRAAVHQSAAADGADAPLVVADTDAIVTAVWAGLGDEPLDPWFADAPFACDLYLVTENDLPWVDDGVRIQGDPLARDRFRAALIAELDRRGLAWVSVGGLGEARLTNALTAMDAHWAAPAR